MAAKRTYVKYKTPPAVAVYPKLDKAYKWDEASQKSLPNPDGDYVTELRLTRKDAQPLIDAVNQAITTSGVKPKNLPYKDEEVDDEKTGNVLFKFKAYGKTKDGAPNKIKFYDSEGHPLKGVVRVTAGSTLRLLGWVSVAKMGARMNIRECQIIDLVEYSEGFEAHKGGSFKAADLDEGDDNSSNTNTTANETQETADDGDEF